MTQSKFRSNKIIARALLIVFWQLLVFFLSVTVLSFVETIISVLLDYDSVKSNTTINTAEYSMAFLFVVAIPNTIASIINKPHLFWITAATSLIVMEIYIFRNHGFFGYVSTIREFCVLSVSLLVSFAISLPLFKMPGRYGIKNTS